MQPKRRLLTAAVTVSTLTLVLTGAAVAWRQAGSGSPDAPPRDPATPAASLDVVYARPFTLTSSYPNAWRADGGDVGAGTLLILDADPELVVPQDGLQPVLYVNREVAERVNHGYPSGRVVAIVPGAAFDLETALIWFGTPELPERVDAASIAAEHTAALAAGLRPLPTPRTQAARAAGGDMLFLEDRTDLEREAARLILTHVPDETAWAESLLTPLVR